MQQLHNKSGWSACRLKAYATECWSGARSPGSLTQAELGPAYGARLACSCRYVEGRAMGSCEDDKEPGMALVTLTDRPEGKAVEARVPLVAARTARFRPGWGCLLDPTS